MGMKCINCGKDNNLKDRNYHAGRCKQCHHPFAFAPSTETNQKLKLTDKFFEKAINDLSMEGSLFFTPKQLHYFLDSRLNKEELFGYFYYLCFYFIIPMFFSWGAVLIYIIWSPVLYSSVAWLISRNLTNASSTTSIKDRLRIIKNLRILLILILTPGLIIAIIYFYNIYIYLLFGYIFYLVLLVSVDYIYYHD